MLANNHVLDWGYKGLAETLDSLHRADIGTCGAGRNAAEAAAPAILNIPDKGRVLVFAWVTEDSGVPQKWAAGESRPGVNLLTNLTDRSLETIAQQVRAVKRPGDLVVASIHWGGNWGFVVTTEQRAFAHRLIDVAGIDMVHGSFIEQHVYRIDRLIDVAGIDMVHGHSSHHVKASRSTGTNLFFTAAVTF